MSLNLPLEILQYHLYRNEKHRTQITLDRVIQNGTWMIHDNMGNCLNKDGKWEYEPHLISSMTDEFLKRARFESLAVAYVFWLEYFENYKQDFEKLNV